VYVKGSDYRDATQDVTGNIDKEKAAVESVGGRLVFTDEEQFSSSALLNRFYKPYSEEAEKFLKHFRTRYTADDIWTYVKSLEDLSILVVGEAIFDQYTYCRPMGKPPKDSIVASRYLSEECFAGGAAAIANHLANFCRQVSLLSIFGDDYYGLPFFKEKLAKNVTLLPVVLPDRPTIRKQRFIEPNALTKMYELQYLDDELVPAAVSQQLMRQFSQQINEHALLVVSDFGHGMISPELQNEFYASKKFMALNTQTNSANLGFNPITKYRLAHYVSIDELELRFAARTKAGELISLARAIKQQLSCPTFMVSRGAGGSSLLTESNDIVDTPVFSNRIVDRTGAGDALFAVTSALAFKKVPSEVIGFVGNCVGMIAVETVGNREPVDSVLLHKYINNLLK
jgi:bifunctional ADP-heptose synthase (sugar kinase/adenylyltransferase)